MAPLRRVSVVDFWLRLGCAVLPPDSELDCISIVLVNTRNPLNIGAAARAMSNFGFFDLRLVVKPYEASFREARSAVGSVGGLVE